MTKTKNKVGRPTVFIEKVVGKLKEAFLNDCNVVQACRYAGIHKDSYYNYIKENKEFSDEIELLRNDLKLKSKFNIAKKIKEGDLDTSKWYLERRAKNEFSLKTISDNTNRNIEERDLTMENIKEIKAKLREEIEGEVVENESIEK
jgi:hypothetical protein